MKILITGAGSVMGQSIYKALAMYDFGEKIEIHFANSDLIAAGLYFDNKKTPIIAKPIFPLAKEENYIDFLKKYVHENDISIVFSGTQHELEKISSLRDKGIKVATIPHHVAQICMNKLQTYEVLSKHDIKIAKTCSLEQYLHEDRIEGAVIIKPNTSSASRNIFKFDNRNSALSFLSQKKLNSKDYIVQNLLEGSEITCGCYIDRYSKKISIIAMARTLTPDGATFYGEFIQNEAVYGYVKKVATSLIDNGLDFGHINVQLIIENDGPCLFEINGRLSSTEAPKAHFGFNSCAAFVVNLVQEKEFTGWSIADRGKFIRYYEEVYF